MDEMTQDSIEPAATPVPQPETGATQIDAERNAVLTSLVSGDSDIVGLVACSIYKQNELDWLVAFSRLKGREPAEAETSAYIVGESTPRRLSIYRHLAQATLEGRGPEVTAASPSSQTSYAVATRMPGKPSPGRDSGRGGIIAFAGLIIVALVAIYFAARFGIPGIVQSR